MNGPLGLVRPHTTSYLLSARRLDSLRGLAVERFRSFIMPEIINWSQGGRELATCMGISDRPQATAHPIKLIGLEKVHARIDIIKVWKMQPVLNDRGQGEELAPYYSLLII